MNEETETPKPADVAGRFDGLVGRAEALLNFLESDFGQSGRDVRIEAIVCEFEGLLGASAKDTQSPMLLAVNRMRAMDEIYMCVGVVDAHGDIYPEPPDAGTQVFVKTPNAKLIGGPSGPSG